MSASGLTIRVLDGPRDVMRTSTVLLMASGTATAEAMVLGTPMVVTYRVASINWWLLPMVVRVRRAALPNLMGRGDLVPESCNLGRLRPSGGSDAAAVPADGARDAMRRTCSMLPPSGEPGSGATRGGRSARCGRHAAGGGRAARGCATLRRHCASSKMGRVLQEAWA